MGYLLKANIIVALFYFCYIFFLKRETFFKANRWFLKLGLLTAALLPLLIIPIYVEIPPTNTVGSTIIATPNQNPSDTFDLTTFFIYMYAIVTSLLLGRFIIQLFSLLSLIKSHEKKKVGQYTFFETTQNIAPFSFFRWIVYNPNQFNDQELELIINHEKVHASQHHTADIILMDIATVLFWFNPIIWLYRKTLKQNLEFIADHYTQKQSDCEEHYQKLLLKVSLPAQNLTFINTFYNSPISLKIFGKQITLFTSLGQVKKRILMLHKSKSNIMNSWKYSIILPVLVIFAMTFNTEIIAQTSGQNSKTSLNDQQNILKFVITKDTKDNQFDLIADKIKENGATINFKNVKRNSKDEITSVKIKFEYNGEIGTHYSKLTEPISPIEISMNPSDGTMRIKKQSSDLSQTFDVKTTEDGTITLKQTDTTKISTTTSETTSDEGDSYHVIYKKINEDNSVNDHIFIETTTDKIDWTNANGEDVKVMSFEKRDKKTKIFTNDGRSPLVILDGKEISKTEMDAFNPNLIESIQVLKDKNATSLYGDKGKNGVILITSKKEGLFLTADGKLIPSTKTEAQKISNILISNNKNSALYIMDGKEITKTQMKAIDPDKIASVDVFKDEKSIKKYGEKGKNGVIIITLKKE